MRNKKLTRSEGFTIIEVLIVLAIAGLIMLIVFLAVPALKRNSNNTQRKSDASALIGAVQEYTNNNSGSLPTAASNFTGNAKLGFYQASDVVYNVNTSAYTTNPTNTSQITINTYSKCNGTQLGGTGAPTPTSRSVTATYFVETSSGTQEQCIDM